MNALRNIAKQLTPGPIRRLRRQLMRSTYERRWRQKSYTEAFRDVYSRNMWGSNGEAFYSGGGSHEDCFVTPYIQTVSSFLESFPEKPAVLDIGCGDFAVGSQLINFASTYTGCDIVPELIEYNRAKFSDAVFVALDATSGDLPSADVFLVREMLQHLPNAAIQDFLENIEGRCRWLVIADMQVRTNGIVFNKDIPPGPSTRAAIGSAVNILQSPFHFRPLLSKTLADINRETHTLNVVAYEVSKP